MKIINEITEKLMSGVNKTYIYRAGKRIKLGKSFGQIVVRVSRVQEDEAVVLSSPYWQHKTMEENNDKFS